MTLTHADTRIERPRAPKRTRLLSNTKRSYSRTEVRKVECPDCLAATGEPCMGPGGSMVCNHLSRVQRAMGLRP